MLFILRGQGLSDIFSWRQKLMVINLFPCTIIMDTIFFNPYYGLSINSLLSFQRAEINIKKTAQPKLHFEEFFE